ncbi:interferon-induced transmembrane protein 1 isoform X2 [Xenopus laevis]|uniref:Interferon-induced transmembrane protein 1 isoform X2 n=2 Tax=Xenopus laevis TaxID=8355 RepID=A0A8J1MWP3_XENLA|nr:interferon-induced transmembrane protein 1 isoform X2 [Xenopus laevis]
MEPVFYSSKLNLPPPAYEPHHIVESFYQNRTMDKGYPVQQPTSSFASVPPSYSHHVIEPQRMELMQNQNISAPLCQSTVVTISPAELPVRDHLVWSIANIIHMNVCCLGLIALLFSVKSRDQKLIGNKTRAQNYGGIAMALNIAATVITSIIII